jgi:flagellar biosynthetic protein FlhB
MPERDFQERTEKATQRRREKAREEGKVAKSAELNAAAVILFGFMTLFTMGPLMADQIRRFMRYTISNAPLLASSDQTFISIITDSMREFFMIMSPVFVALVIVAVAINVAQVGFKITTKPLEPKFDRLNLVSGFKRLFSVKSGVDAIKNIAKLTVIGFVAYKSIASDFTSFFDYPDMTITQLAAAMGKLSLLLALKVGGVILAIAVLDYLFQRHEYEKSIRMSRQEIKEEYKDTDGDPMIRGRIKQLQREMSRKRMLTDLKTADVVVTNPTHIAVALKYDSDEMSAPTVVAKGERLIAEKIKKLAVEFDIPIVEDKPLARALFKVCDIGQIVPANLYRAVAEILAYVYRLKGKAVN